MLMKATKYYYVQKATGQYRETESVGQRAGCRQLNE